MRGHMFLCLSPDLTPGSTSILGSQSGLARKFASEIRVKASIFAFWISDMTPKSVWLISMNSHWQCILLYKRDYVQIFAYCGTRTFQVLPLIWWPYPNFCLQTRGQVQALSPPRPPPQVCLQLRTFWTKRTVWLNYFAILGELSSGLSFTVGFFKTSKISLIMLGSFRGKERHTSQHPYVGDKFSAFCTKLEKHTLQQQLSRNFGQGSC